MNEIESKLQKLRDMYKKYPNKRESILMQAKVLKIALTKSSWGTTKEEVKRYLF